MNVNVDIEKTVADIMRHLNEPFTRNIDQRLSPELSQGIFTTIERTVRQVLVAQAAKEPTDE